MSPELGTCGYFKLLYSGKCYSCAFNSLNLIGGRTFYQKSPKNSLFLSWDWPGSYFFNYTAVPQPQYGPVLRDDNANINWRPKNDLVPHTLEFHDRASSDRETMSTLLCWSVSSSFQHKCIGQHYDRISFRWKKLLGVLVYAISWELFTLSILKDVGWVPKRL